LSRDDELQGDSNSIVNQKRLLEQYAQKNGFKNPVHYTDDGFSGANFERPAWKKLIEDVEAGKVATVIAKDMSRIGRNYLEVGFYTEVVFPQKQVRFIAIGNGVDSDEPCVKLSGGYDSNFVLNGNPAAVLKGDKSGIQMTVLTTEPGVQVYSANFLTQRKGKNGSEYNLRDALCLETQHFPDSIHHPEWPTCVLKKGERFSSKTSYEFSF
jgi:hypothetical protein